MTIYLRNHDLYSIVLEYKLGKGPIQQINRDIISNNSKTDCGFYVEIDNTFVGYFPTEKGPIFFYKNKEYLLSDGAYTAEVRKNTGKYQFILRHGDRVCVKISYPPVKDKAYDCWSDEEMVDFFLWMEDSLTNRREKFIKFNTI